MTIKNILTKIWEFIKKNWLVILAIIGAALIFYYGSTLLNKLFSKDKSFSELIQQQQKQHQKVIADLLKTVEDQRIEQQRIEHQFDIRIKELDQKYSDELAKISKNRIARQTQLENDPTELGRSITDVFGIPQSN